MSATTKDMIWTASHYAQSAANYLGNAERWCGWTDKDVDDRDPAVMIRDSLASAEADVRAALKYIDEVRTAINSGK